MHFFAASIATVSALVVATQAAPFTTVSHMAGAQQVYIDTTSCNNSGSILPQIYGLGSSNGSNYVTPQRSSTNRFEFTLPLTYSGRLWLRDTAETGNANDGSDVQSVEFTFYENPTAAKPNKAYITKVEKQIDPITAVRFFSSPKGEYISGTNMTTLTSTDDQDALILVKGPRLEDFPKNAGTITILDSIASLDHAGLCMVFVTMKVGKACVQCREGKRKCDRKGTGAPCAQCLRRHLQCSGAVHHTSGSSHSSNPVFILPSTDNVDEVMPDSAALKELIDLYIWYIHDKPHSLFHEPTLRYAISNGTVSKAVLYGILGLSARFSQYEAARSQGPKYAMEAKRLVKADMENICLENIQACVLCGNICFADCNSDAESIYFAIANRMAQLFHLEAEVSSDDAITRETKRRVWWSLYLQECWASAGTGLLRQFHHGGATPAVPMSEPMFLQLHGDADPRPREPGIWAHMITLVRIFADIQDLNYHLVEEESWSGEYVEAPVRNLSSQLEAFKNSLPDTLQNTPENFTYNIQQRLGRTFVALHLSYHHFATLLFFQFLDQERPSTPGVAACAERCKFHAGAFSDLLWASNEHPHAQAVYNIVGHMTVVSSSVLLHTLLFGNEDELPVAKKRLESNFRVLMRLKSYWPSVELMLSRLLNFQSACLQSTSPHTHKIDKWMIRFLLQHVLTLDERLRADSSLAIQTPDSEEPSVEAQRLSHRGRELDKLVRKFY